LEFAAAEFDCSLSLLVFNFIPDPAKALAELRRVTRPGGCVAAAVWDYGGRMQMLRVFWDAAVALDPKAEKLDERHMPLCRSGELSRLWEQGGLERVEEQPLTVQMRFASWADYWDPFLLGQGPAGVYAKRLSSDALARLAGEVKQRLRLAAEDVRFTIEGRVWAVRGAAPGNA
jgi:SAM-dependent methyltransferase